MANRFPLIFNNSADQIQELASGDTLDLTGNNLRGAGIITATTLSVSGNVSIAGTLTYEDVTNVDSIGLITARSGVQFGESGNSTTVIGDGDGIGIGTDNPSNLLHIEGSTDQIKLSDGAGSFELRAGNAFFIKDNGTTRLQITSDGNIGITTTNVGIQTTNIPHALTVNGNIQISNGSNIRSDSSAGNYRIQGGSTFPGGTIKLSGGQGTDSITFSTSGASQNLTDHMRINGGGTIGIGTTNVPGSADVVIRKTNPELALVANAQFSSFLMFGDANDYDNGMIEYDNTNSNKRMRFIVNTSEAMRIDHGGDVGIGTVGPDSRLHIQGNSDTAEADCQITIEDEDSTAGSGIPSIQFKVNSANTARIRGTDEGLAFATGSSNNQRMFIDSIGNIRFLNGALIENGEIETTARNGTQAVDLVHGQIHNFTTASAGTWTPNFRINSSTTLNSAMGTGDVCSPTMIVAKGATTHFSNSIQIDGSAVTPEFLGGAPTEGGGSGTFDIYSYTIIKTADATFTAFCSVSTFE